MEKISNAGTVYKESKYYYWEPTAGRAGLSWVSCEPYVFTVQYNTETIRICCTHHNTKMINASYITILTTKM